MSALDLKQEKFLDSLEKMNSLFWNFSGFENNIINSKNNKLTLYKEYNNFFSSDKIKEIISKSLDYRFQAIDDLVEASLSLKNLIDKNNKCLYHYLPPNHLASFKLDPLYNLAYSDVSHTKRYYSRLSKFGNYSIQHSVDRIFDKEFKDKKEWFLSTSKLPNNINIFNEADIYLKKSNIIVDANDNIRKIVSLFSEISQYYDIKSNFVIYKYKDKNFCIDFKQSDILTEDEFSIKW